MTSNEPWYPEAFLQNQWTRKYRKLIESAQLLNREKQTGEHVIHHIIPKSFYRTYRDDGWLDGDWDAPENRVVLSHKEHAQAHLWLWERMTYGIGKKKMAAAMILLLGDLPPLKVTVTLIEKLMRQVSIAATEQRRDNTIHTFYHIPTRRTVIGSRWQVEEQENLPKGTLWSLVKPKNPWRTSRGWSILSQDEHDTKSLRTRTIPSRRDNVVRIWYHIPTGRIVTGARWQVEEQEGMEPQTLLPLIRKRRGQRTCLGWTILQSVDDSVKVMPVYARLKGRDDTIRTWYHIPTGRVVTSTRRELEDQEGLKPKTLLRLTRKKPSKTCHGWSIQQPNN
jgi:hypothetical protein